MKTQVEKAIGIAAKLYECRDTMRGLKGCEYASYIAPHVRTLRQAAEVSGRQILEVALDAVKSAHAKCDTWGVVLILAAAAEAIEPSEPSAASAASAVNP
jgi:hypothetical protein